LIRSCPGWLRNGLFRAAGGDQQKINRLTPIVLEIGKIANRRNFSLIQERDFLTYLFGLFEVDKSSYRVKSFEARH
jgi:hypothetical protein